MPDSPPLRHENGRRGRISGGIQGRSSSFERSSAPLSLAPRERGLGGTVLTPRQGLGARILAWYSRMSQQARCASYSLGGSAHGPTRHLGASGGLPLPGQETKNFFGELLERQRGLLSSAPQEPYRSYSHLPLDVVLGDPVGIEGVETSPRRCILGDPVVYYGGREMCGTRTYRRRAA